MTDLKSKNCLLSLGARPPRLSIHSARPSSLPSRSAWPPSLINLTYPSQRYKIIKIWHFLPPCLDFAEFSNLWLLSTPVLSLYWRFVNPFQNIYYLCPVQSWDARATRSTQGQSGPVLHEPCHIPHLPSGTTPSCVRAGPGILEPSGSHRTNQDQSYMILDFQDLTGHR